MKSLRSSLCWVVCDSNTHHTTAVEQSAQPYLRRHGGRISGTTPGGPLLTDDPRPENVGLLGLATTMVVRIYQNVHLYGVFA